MKRKHFWIIGSLLALIVLMIVLKKKGVIGADTTTQVALANVDNRTIIETVNASGRIYPEVEVKISSDVSGEITELTVEEGDSVKRGQVLAKVFADIYNIQQDQAAAVVNQQQFQVANNQAQLEGLRSIMQQTEAQYNRQKQLLDSKVISRQEFEVAENSFLTARANYNAALKGIDAARQSVNSARANLRRATKDLSRTTLIAPMDGVVSLLNVKKGERVVGTAQMAGTEMMRVADMSKIEVRVDVTENDIPKVHIGDSAIVNVDAYLGKKFKGVVYQIASSSSGTAAQALASATGNEVTNYKVFIRLDPASYNDLIDKTKARSFPFRPGMTASADIQTKVEPNILSVPINSVTTRSRSNNVINKVENQPGKAETAPLADVNEEDKILVVFVYEPATKTVKQVPVETGIQDVGYIQILSGLKKGQQVVSEPYNVIFRDLQDNKKVKVVNKEDLFKEKK